MLCCSAVRHVYFHISAVYFQYIYPSSHQLYPIRTHYFVWLALEMA